MRLAVLAAIPVLAFAALGTASAAPETRVKAYCSGTGDVCYGIFRTNSQYRFKLTLAAKYFSRYRVCVTPLGQKATCKSFPVKKTGAQWGGTVDLAEELPRARPAGLPRGVAPGRAASGPAAHVLLAGSLSR